jgi:hypothetical protein
MHDFGAIRVGGGDAVETRSKEEIPSTLDELGALMARRLRWKSFTIAASVSRYAQRLTRGA